jgi:hypothetical protein
LPQGGHLHLHPPRGGVCPFIRGKIPGTLFGSINMLGVCRGTTWAVQTAQYIHIGAAKSIGTALFTTNLGYLKKISTFSFRIIYFRMFRIRMFKKKFEKSFLWPYF